MEVAKKARKSGIAIIYELDDDLLAPPENTVWGLNYIRSGKPELIESLLACADLIKAGSPELSKRLQARGHRTLYMPYAADLLKASTVTEPPYRIGYFGTPHHQPDIQWLLPVLYKVKKESGDMVNFEFIGSYPQDYQVLGTQTQIYPCERNYQRFLSELRDRYWAIGLAPLLPHAFNNAKSDSKFRDYSAAGIPGIYSLAKPYSRSVRHGISGWLCETADEWYQAITEALQLAKKRRQILRNARKQLASNNNKLRIAGLWASLLKTCTERGDSFVKSYN